MPPHRFAHFYRGGDRITELRGAPGPHERSPEEWLASTTTRFDAAPAGLSALPDGRLLRDAVAAEPEAWLGPEHVATFGADTGVLVKLLDAGERLPVHVHPDRAWAGRHLGCRYGKTEAWYVVAADEGAQVHLGFRHDVPRAVLAERVEREAGAALLDVMHARTVSAGDGILVPAGWPHAIGAGILVVEAQEPTDFSILLEWTGFDLDGPAEGHLGLGFQTALGAVDVRGHAPDEVDALVGPRRLERSDTLLPVLPRAADDYFRMHVARPATAVTVPAGFDVLAVPYGAGDWTLRGDVEAVVCRPALAAPQGPS
jgi:mannose-6-phosphate isomerase